MANLLYPLYKQSLLNTPPNLTSVDIKVILVDTDDYVFSTGHEFLDDVTGFAGSVVATSPNLGTKTTTNGVFDAADTTFTAVSGDECEALIVYHDSGTPSTSRLMAFLDSAGGSLPVTPNGGDITVQWASDADKIFAI